MKRLIVFIFFILVFLTGYRTVPVLGQEDKDASEIKKVVEEYFNYFNNRDVDAALRLVSPEYSDVDADGKKMDFAKFKLNLEKMLNSENYVDQSVGDFTLSDLSIKGNKATFEIECIYKVFNLKTFAEKKIKQKRSAVFVKENGEWKIIQWRRLK